MASPILEFRIALTAEDYDRLVAFYEDVLGLEADEIWTAENNKGVIYDMGKGTLEILDERSAATVDQLEVGKRVSGQVRFALQVEDVDAVVAQALANGATLVHEPTVTPWNHKNARLQAPDGLQVTLFQVL
ncbi:MAG: VOC family protein [Chloroflexi bacterium]|nr:VOC family protein [Chloroflexota bacterium]MCC6891477.1 VOC family protein [Anaerolineae bacterium]